MLVKFILCHSLLLIHLFMNIKLAGENITNNVSRLSLTLSVGQHSQFRLTMTDEDRSALFKGTLSQSSEKWIGKSLEVEGLFKGVVTSVSLSRGYAGSSDFTIRGQSPTIHLDDGIHTRSFSEKQLQQILDTVMQPYGGKFEDKDIKPQHGKIKYCVQYRESNFNFMNRLAARYGEWFFYDGQKLTFGKPAGGETIRLNFPREVSTFNIAMKTVPVNFKLKMYDYKNHSKFPQKESAYPEPANPYAKIAFNKSKNEIYPQMSEVPINIGMNEEDLDQVATLRQNVHLNELVVLTGSSRDETLKLGSIIKITDDREDLMTIGTDDYGEYVITHITHEFASRGENYSNHFEAIPKDAAIPPLSSSPDPPPCEAQEATIMENNDPKGLGRVKVQFLWQKGAANPDDRTNWIRCAAHSGGGDRGLYILPEIGDTVLIAFEHDHPERGFVWTSMYHSEAKPEHHDPGNMKKALKTKGGHQILMNDTKGSETMAFFSPTDITAKANAGKIDVTAKTTIAITSETDTITVTSPKTITIKNTGTDILIDAQGNITIHSKADIKIESSGKMELISGGPMTMNAPSITATATKGNIALDASAAITANAKGGNIALDASAAITANAKGGNVALDASASITANAKGGNVSLDASAAVKANAPDITLTGGKSVDASAPKASLTGTASAKVSGGVLELSASGITTVTGSVVKLN